MDEGTEGIQNFEAFQEEKMRARKNLHTGSDFADFLAEEGLEAEVAARAAKRTFVHQLEKQIAKKKKPKGFLRSLFGSPTTAGRVLDEEYTSLSLDTMSKAASALGCELQVSLVSKKSAAGK